MIENNQTTEGLMKTQEQAAYEQLLDEQRALMLKLRAAYNAWMASLQPEALRQMRAWGWSCK